MFKKYEDFIERIDKKLSKLFDDRDGSTLNPFLYEHYSHLKGEELDESLENMEYNIFYNNNCIKELKEILNQKTYHDKVIEIITESINDLEYENDTGEEIIIVLKKQKQKEIDKANKPKFHFKNLIHKSIVRRK